MILPKVRDSRLVTERRGGSLTDADHRILALWAASCAERVLPLFERTQPHDPRPLSGAARFAAYAAGQAACVAHVPEHDLGAAAYAIKAIQAAALPGEEKQAGKAERDWQRSQLPEHIRALVIDDQRRRNSICWFVFEG